MKKILGIILTSTLVFTLMGCGNKVEEKKEIKQEVLQDTEKVNEVKKEEKKILGAEDEFIFKKDGKDYYSLKINGVKTADDFEYKEYLPESNRNHIIEVDYTYKNIAKDDEKELQIHGDNLKIMDSTGAMAESSYMFPKQQPKVTPVGGNCTVQSYYGLANKSDKIKINFTSGTLKQTAEFEILIK